MTDQSADTNWTRMEHILLLTITIGSKYLTISSAWLGENFIVYANQSRASIDKREHGDRIFLVGSWKSGNKKSVDCGRNVDDKIGMNLSRIIRILQLQITSTREGIFNIFDSFRGMSDLA